MTQIAEMSFSGVWEGIQGAANTAYETVCWAGDKALTAVQNAWKAVSPLFSPLAGVFANPIVVAVSLGVLSGGLMWYANSENNELARAAAQASSLATAIGLGVYIARASLI